MRIGILTYAAQHLKTEQVVSGLMIASNRKHEYELLALPFVERAKRSTLFEHRPSMAAGAHPRSIARCWRIPYCELPDAASIPVHYDALIVAGSGILPPNVVSALPVVNAHPGLIPAVRGLDSFKWAIYDGVPLGITVHLIDENVDLGRIVRQFQTPIFVTDTLHTLARRHYELEIWALIHAWEAGVRGEFEPYRLAERPPRKRMTRETEKRFLSRFDQYKAKFAV